MSSNYTISLIAACSENRIIGFKGKMPWHVSSDLKYFRQKTLDHVVIMGKGTFSSLNEKALPHRINIVVSSNDFSLKQDKLYFVKSIESAFELAYRLSSLNEIFVIGGGDIYCQTIDFADKIYLTEIKGCFEGDTFFPEINADVFELSSKNEFQEGVYSGSFCIYSKR